MKELEFKISTGGVFPRSVCDGGVQGDEAATDIVFKIEKDLKAELTKLQEGGYRLQFRIDITDGGGGLIATDALTVDLEAETPEITYTVGQDISSVGGIANFFLIISAFDSDNNLCLDKYSYPCRVRFYPSSATAEKAKSETFSGALADAVKKADDRANAAMTSADKAETSASSAAASAKAAGSSAHIAQTSASAAFSNADKAAASEANASKSSTAAANSAAEAANSASEAAASAASAASSAEAVNPDSYYKKDAADKQFAERSSENSTDPSSVEYAKAVWIKQDDTGTNGAAFLWDDYKESPLALWSSEKTMETVRDTIKDAQADYYKKDETYAKSETYSKAETNKQFAERSSEDSIASSSVAFAQFLWIKGNDEGDDSSAMLDDSHSADQQYLWSSKKTMEETQNKIADEMQERIQHDFVYRYAARSSEGSAIDSSVSAAKSLYLEGDDSVNSTAVLSDLSAKSNKVLWSSKKTMDKVRAEQGNLSANAVKKTVSGQTVQINDASPLIHELDISVSKNIFPKAYNILPDEFSFADGVVTGTVEADGKIIININSRTAETLAFDVCTFNLSSGTKYIYSGNPNGCSYGSYFSRITRTSGAEVHSLTTSADTEFTVDYGGEFKFTILIQAHRDPQQIVFTPRLGVADAADEVEVIEYDGGGNVAAKVTPEADGTVKGIKSYPTMKITTNNSAYAVNVTYNRDLNRVVEELQQAIISLGGNV